MLVPGRRPDYCVLVIKIPLSPGQRSGLLSTHKYQRVAEFRSDTRTLPWAPTHSTANDYEI